MPNALKIDVHNRVVVFRDEFVDGDAATEPFYVNGGFGANPGGPGLTHRGNEGSGLFGVFLSYGQFVRMEGWMVAATVDEDTLSPEHAGALALARVEHPSGR